MTLNREEPIAPVTESDRARGPRKLSAFVHAYRSNGDGHANGARLPASDLVIMALGLVAYLTVGPLIFPE